MLENYLNVITNMETYVDGLIVVDSYTNIVYIRHYAKGLTPISEKDSIGKSLFEIYPSMDPKNSTIMKALTTGEVTFNCKNTLSPVNGPTFEVLDDTFPIKENGRIIGAVCITHSVDNRKAFTALDLSSGANSRAPKQLFTDSDIIGRSEAIQVLRNQINRVAETSSSLLIYGETGTGKEMVAQSVHFAELTMAIG